MASNSSRPATSSGYGRNVCTNASPSNMSVIMKTSVMSSDSDNRSVPGTDRASSTICAPYSATATCSVSRSCSSVRAATMSS
ncbi:Uncharacterised protein [Mycobacteroides abscessus subsp. abscessus]|nr:Uncharacterised protein [Mycobacteroides abscessus subsp. abscessus]